MHGCVRGCVRAPHCACGGVGARVGVRGPRRGREMWTRTMEDGETSSAIVLENLDVDLVKCQCCCLSSVFLRQSLADLAVAVLVAKERKSGKFETLFGAHEINCL